MTIRISRDPIYRGRHFSPLLSGRSEAPQSALSDIDTAQRLIVITVIGHAAWERMPALNNPDLEQIPDTIQNCRRCDLWRHSSQAVPGEGPAHARILLVGEQPGDEEDLRGHPFIGPAGRVLDQCLEAAGLARAEVFVTNAVKHFKWEPRGKRRLHKKPDLREIDACNVWLHVEISRVRPRVLVALGATALRALLGRTATIDAARRQILQHASGVTVVATYHPSAILRARDEQTERLRTALIKDLKKARGLGASTA